jgi:hypothetical protein
LGLSCKEILALPAPKKKLALPAPKKNLALTKKPDTVFAGHGTIEPETFIMPAGTSLTIYSRPGAVISDDLGQVIEALGDSSSIVKSNSNLGGLYKRTYNAGDTTPNLVLHNPKDYPPLENISDTSVTVKKSTPVSKLLNENMGSCHWAACTHIDGHANENLIYHTDGVYKTEGDKVFKEIDGEWIEQID